MSEWLTNYNTFRQQPWSPTSLSNKEEQQFQKWFTGTKLFNSIKNDIATENNIPVSELDNARVVEMLTGSKDYDYRGAWKAGIKETISPYDNRPHWPSSTSSGQLLKSPEHETAWKEFFMRQYKADPDSIGLHTLDQATQWQKQINNNVPTPVNYSDPFGFTIR